MKRWLFLTAMLVWALIGVVVVKVAWGSPPFQGPAVPHPVEGREACLDCHTTEGEGDLVLPEDHADRTEATCLACHSAPEHTPPEASPTEPSPTPPPAQADPTEPPPTAAPAEASAPPATAIPADAYKGPEFCAQCHTPHIEEWETSTHAMAFQDEIFQASWVENQQPGYCLKCHATGYDPNTGHPVFNGVTCESCHGVYEEGHPNVMMTVDAAAERCGVCHETTYQEWLLSGHSERGVKCASCHAVHTQGLLFATSTALCAGCHGERYEDFAHASHAEHNVTCADCHIYRPRDGPLSEGRLPTGHFFSVESEACTQCHTRDSIHSPHGESAESSELYAELTERISSLEGQLEELEAGGTRNLSWGLAGGAIGGLMLGALISWLIVRRARGEQHYAQTIP